MGSLISMGIKLLLKILVLIIFIHLFFFTLATTLYCIELLILNSEFSKIGALFSLAMIIRILFVISIYLHFRKVRDASILKSIIYTPIVDFIVFAMSLFYSYNVKIIAEVKSRFPRTEADILEFQNDILSMITNENFTKFQENVIKSITFYMILSSVLILWSKWRRYIEERR